MEELESENNKSGASVYDTFHGAEQRRMVVRKSKRSWSEQHQGHHIQASMVECNIANNSNSMEMEAPSRFTVDQVWEQERRYRNVVDMQEEEEDDCLCWKSGLQGG